MEDRDKTEILVAIGKLEVQVKGTNDHLSNMNGSISKLYARDEANLKALRDHEVNCPGLVTIQEIKTKLETGDHPGSKAINDALTKFNLAEAAQHAKEKTSDDWRKTLLLPLLRYAAMGLIILFLLHAHDLLKLASKITP